ncbi:MAG: OFA family oxalate/formate antiporter-like MFS transporter [Phycisphaerales bacterium]|jgi:OFA family oxalate/formate antiporter-like MFS transporter
MPLGPKPDNPPRLYFGWPMLAIACLTTIATSPGQSYIVGGLFLESYETGLGLSTTTITFAYLVATVCAAIPLTLVGKASDHYGPRRVMLAVSIGLALACGYMGLVQGFWMLLVGFFLLRFLGQGALSVLSGHTVALWFEKRLGTAEAIRIASMSAAVLLLPVPIAGLINTFEWQGAYPILGVLVLLLTLPWIMLFFRNRPQDAGQVLDQHEIPQRDETDEPLALDDEPEILPPDDPAFTLRQALRTRAYWALAGVPILSGFVGTAIVFHLTGLVGAGQFFEGTDEEIGKANLALGAAVMLPWGVASGLCMPVGGWLIDRVKPRHLLAASPPILALSIIMLWMGMSLGVGSFYFLGMGVFGVSQACAMAAAGPTIARWFGRTHHGAIRGFTSTLGVVGTACGPFVLGLSSDTFGGYTPGFLLFIALCAPLVWTVWTVEKPDSPNLPTGGPTDDRDGSDDDPDPDSDLGPELIDDATRVRAVDEIRARKKDEPGPPVRYDLDDVGESIPLVDSPPSPPAPTPPPAPPPQASPSDDEGIELEPGTDPIDQDDPDSPPTDPAGRVS